MMTDMKDLFRNPSSEYRTAPLWVWNAQMTKAQIDRHLEELKSHGFGGAFVHPRPGMRITYLDENWYQAWGYALEKAKELGIKLNIYDENSYPSGFGGGHVSSELPDCLAESITYRVLKAEEMDFADRPGNWKGDHTLILAYASCVKDNKRVFLQDLTALPRSAWKGAGEEYVLVEHMEAQTTGWLANFANVDLLRPEVTEKFLEIVYDGYAKHFQADFGDTIRAIFTDEPALSGSAVYGCSTLNLPFSRFFAMEFQRIKGYDIISRIPSLFEDWEGMDNQKIRFDFYEVTQQLWEKNFLIPIHKWCQEHNINFTGHFMEDGWPLPYYEVLTPGVMSFYEHEDWPGIDLLLTRRLKNDPAECQQLSMFECASAGHQFGKERIFCEAFGAGGYDSTVEDYKRIGDYLFVTGINYINEHLSYTSYIGSRKRDHPQSFDWRQPWWNTYTQVNDYFGRLSAALSMGKPEEKLLLLNPTMTGYLVPIKQKDQASHLVHNRLAAEPDMSDYIQMFHELRAGQYDFALGDEIILRKHGAAKEGQIRINEQKYQYVILHDCVQNMLSSTITLLKEFMSQGGTVLCVGRPGNRVDGFVQEELVASLVSEERFLIFHERKELYDWLAGHYEREFLTRDTLPVGVQSIHRILPDGRRLFFLTNFSKTDVDTEMTFAAEALEKWDPWTGESSVYAKGENGKVTAPLHLLDGESLLLVAGKSDMDACAVEVCAGGFSKTTLEIQEIVPEKENVWPLEYCSLELDGQELQECFVGSAAQTIYKRRGFKQNPWDNVVQYHTRTYDMNRHYGAQSGFTAKYYFKVEEGYQPEILKLSVEYGDKYTICVNSKPVGAPLDEYYFEEDVASYDIAGLIQEGTNIVTLQAEQFDVEMELDLVTLRGSFGVFVKDHRFIMGREKTLEPGDWTEQGYPFYDGAMLYKAEIEYDGVERISLGVPKTEATALSVVINGHEKILNVDGVKPVDITSCLVPGKNSIAVRLCGSLKNYFGPHYNPAKERRSAWPDMWRFEMSKQPDAEQCDLIAYGLIGEITLIREGGDKE